MFEYAISNHARVRMSQRAVRGEHIELVLRCGTQIGPAEWFMKRSDVDREIEELKRMFRHLERTIKNGKQRFERALKPGRNSLSVSRVLRSSLQATR